MFEFIEDEALRTQAEDAHTVAMDAINASIEDKIKEATGGLKSKNDELLDEKKKIQETLKNFKDLDPEKAKEALKFLEENEYAQMIKDGKVDEIIEKKTSQMRSDHEAALGELTTKFTDAEQNGSLYKGMYEKKMIEDALRKVAVEKGIRPEAISDILMRGNKVFSLDDNTGIEARDKEGKLVKTKDDKVLTADLWIESFKDTAPHYFPESESSGAFSGTKGKNELDVAIQKAAKSGNMNEYRRLRAKKAKKA